MSLVFALYHLISDSLQYVTFLYWKSNVSVCSAETVAFYA